MAKFRNYQTNFSGGLLSKGMLGRLDLAQYENGCLDLENWWPKITGGMRRRPGSIYLNTSPYTFRIEPFIFSEEQVYLFAFYSDPSYNGVKIYNAESGALIFDLILSVTLSETIIRDMSITHIGDVMFCAHETFPTLMIRRTSFDTFEEDSFDFESVTLSDGGNYPKTMPFFKFADSKITISVDDYVKGNSATVTASEPFFVARHVGKAIRYRNKQLLVTALIGIASPATQCTATILEDLDRSARLTFDLSPTGVTREAEPEDFELGEIVVGRESGVKAEIVRVSSTTIDVSMLAGSFTSLGTWEGEEIEGLNSGNIANVVTKTDLDPLASVVWDEEAFSLELGYPSVIEFHSQRLWLAGSPSLPAHIFGSRVAAFFNFDVGDAFPADSIQVVISDKTVNKITDIVSGRHLQVFTDAGEFYAPQSEDQPLEPDSFDLRKQTRYGSRTNIEPKLFDESTLFVQAQGTAIREFIWVDKLRGYSADAVSLIAEEHINDVQEVEVLYGGYDRPEQIAFFVNGDGSITWYHAARAEQIRTWGKWTTNGRWKSLAVLQDKLYALVERDIDGVATRMLERFEMGLTVDSAVTRISPDMSAVTGFTAHAAHLVNTEVDAVVSVDVDNIEADYFIGRLTVGATGDTEITDIIAVDPVTNMTVGLAFTQRLETMPIEIQDKSGVTSGMPKRIVSADVYLLSTLAAQLQGNRVLTFRSEIDLQQRPKAITGPRKFYLLGYDERPTLVVENNIPLPCEALSLAAEVEY